MYLTVCRQLHSLGQPADFNLILKRFRMEDEQPVSTPLNPHLRLDGIAETALAPRPGVAFAVNVYYAISRQLQITDYIIARASTDS